MTSFLGVLSAALVALGFVASASGGIDRPFHAFGAVALGVVAIVGILTFLRCIQSSIEDLRLLRRIEELRALYVDLAPGLAPHLTPPSAGDPDAIRHAHGMQAGAWTQILLTMAGLVGVVTSVALGAAAGFVTRLVVDHDAAPWGVAFIVGLGAIVVHTRFQMRTMRAALVP
jgi:hypothetical protein